ncbi:hypothetical protein LCGC14_2618960, partial [marine sediment metagenome]
MTVVALDASAVELPLSSDVDASVHR